VLINRSQFAPRLRPDEAVTPEELERGKRFMVQDAAWASLVGALYGGVILVGFALELGATPVIIGLLAAIPFLSQLGQLPAILLIERVRARRKIAVLVVAGARVLILSLALLPWIEGAGTQLKVLIGAQVAITLLGSFAACSVNSWFHELLAGQELGALYAQRLFWSTMLASLGALAAGNLIEHWPFGDRMEAYSACFAAAGIVGFIGVHALSRIPEPPMHRTGPQLPILSLLFSPFADLNFRRLIVFMASWNCASNLAAPFLAVYLLKQLDYGLGVVTAMWAVSQIANALTVYSWGRISDRLTNKAILATALPAYFGCLIALPLSSLPEKHILTLPMLWGIHIVMGMASGGIGLATGNIGLKLAPQGKGTAYLASVRLAGSIAAGLAALAGGALATWFSVRELTIDVRWSSPSRTTGFIVMQFAHWEFLFAISFAVGMYVMHALSRIEEGKEISERAVIRDFAFETLRAFGEILSSVAGSLASLLPLGRLFDRRKRNRMHRNRVHRST
jgi:MFS family permease